MDVTEGSGLPDGWKKEAVERKSGSSVGKYDVYISNREGKRFRSRKELEVFCSKNDIQGIDLDKVFKMNLSNSSSKVGLSNQAGKSKKIKQENRVIIKKSDYPGIKFSATNNDHKKKVEDPITSQVNIQRIDPSSVQAKVQTQLRKDKLLETVQTSKKSVTTLTDLLKSKISPNLAANRLKIQLLGENNISSRLDRYVSQPKENNDPNEKQRISISTALDHIQDLRVFYDQNGLTNWDGLLMVENEVINLVNTMRKEEKVRDEQRHVANKSLKQMTNNVSSLKRKLDSLAQIETSQARGKVPSKSNNLLVSRIANDTKTTTKIMKAAQEPKPSSSNSTIVKAKKLQNSENTNEASAKKKNTDTKESNDKQGDDSGSAVLRMCKFCNSSYDKESNLKNHTLNHFKEQILPELPGSPPFQCPKCELKPARDKITLLRHYAFAHDVYLSYCTKEDLKGTPQI